MPAATTGRGEGGKGGLREPPGRRWESRLARSPPAAAGLAQGSPSPVASSPLPRPSEGPGQRILGPQPVLPPPHPPWVETLGCGSRPVAGEAPVKPLHFDVFGTYSLL